MISSNSVTLFLEAILIFKASSGLGLLLPLTYLENMDFFISQDAAKFVWIIAFFSKYSLNFIINPKIVLTSDNYKFTIENTEHQGEKNEAFIN